VRFAWMTVLAFLRIGTSPRIFEEPLSMDEAASIVTSWLAQPAVEILEPGERYWSILVGLLRDAQVSGALVSDAALAALAIEHGSAKKRGRCADLPIPCRCRRRQQIT
jgi:hypothetical protein